MPRLTDLSIKNLPIPTTGQVTYDDEGSPLKLRVSYAGSKTFLVMLGSGQRRTIGRFGEVSLMDAREAARRLKAEKTLGRILPSTVSFDTAQTEYLDDITVRPATRAYYERYLDYLSSKPLAPVSSLTPADLHRIIDKLPATARNQAIATYKAFFSWCVRRHYLEISPCQRFTLTKEKTRSRVLSDTELKAIWLACPNDSFGKIVKLLLLTGQRRGEIAALEYSWIKNHQSSLQSSDHSITFPSYVAKNGQEHTIPLSYSASVVIFFDRKTVSPLDLAFPSSRTGQIINGWAKLKECLDKKSTVTDWTLHDLRRTFATRCAELGVQPHIIERILNHTTGSLTPIARTYNKARYFPEMRAAMELYENHISRLLDQK